MQGGVDAVNAARGSGRVQELFGIGKRANHDDPRGFWDLADDSLSGLEPL